MTIQSQFTLPALLHPPPLDSSFQPAAVWNRSYAQLVRATESPASIHFALEQGNGSILRHAAEVLPELASTSIFELSLHGTSFEIPALVERWSPSLLRRSCGSWGSFEEAFFGHVKLVVSMLISCLGCMKIPLR